MTHSVRTHLHGRAILHLARAIAVVIGFALLAVVLYFALAAIVTGPPLAVAAGIAVAVLAAVVVFLYFRWALK